MRSSRDTYGIKTLRIGNTKAVAGRSYRNFREAMSQMFRRHEWVRHKAFLWREIEGGIEIERVR